MQENNRAQVINVVVLCYNNNLYSFQYILFLGENMGLNGYDPYPGEGYILLPTSSINRGVETSTRKQERESCQIHLAERLELIAERLAKLRARLRGDSSPEECRFVPPKHYQGIVDIVLHPNECGGVMVYALLLDQDHECYQYWHSGLLGNSMRRGSPFTFNPLNVSFILKGKLLREGELNSFRYYFVDVQEVCGRSTAFAIKYFDDQK